MIERHKNAYNQDFSKELLPRVSDLIRKTMGLNFAVRNYSDLFHRLCGAALEKGSDNVEEFILLLLSSSPDDATFDCLSRHLTTGETSFFRDESLFGVLERKLLPELLESRKKGEKYIRIWSAGCASGEEAYSLAILLDRLIPDKERWDIAILATDINREALEKAKTGIYGHWSFRNTPEWVKNLYFTQTNGNRYEIKSQIRRMVNFSHLNLAKDSYPSAHDNIRNMDLILCRNVLMYFSSEHYASAARRFYQCLSEGGYLVVGPVETSPFFFSCFRPLYYDNVTFYKKDSDYQPNGTKTVYASSERSHVCGLPKKRAKAYPLPAAIYGKTAKENNRRDTGLTYKAIDERTQTSDVIPENKTVQLARIKADEGNFNEALALCDGAVEEDALNPSVYFLKAMILDEMQSRKEAAVFLKKVLYLDPGHILAHFSLGNIFLNDGQITEAKRYYGNTLSLLLSCSDGDILPESDGITAGRLRGIVGTLLAGRTNKE